MSTRSETPSAPVYADDEIDLREVIVSIWRRRWFIAFFTIALFAGAVAYLSQATYRYTVELKVAPVEGEGGSQLAAFGNLAGVVGLQVPRDMAKIDLYLALLKSEEVAARLVISHDLMVAMFPAEWDDEVQEWRQPPQSLLGRLVGTLKGWLGAPRQAWAPPSSRRVLSFLEKEVVINQSSQSPVVTVTVEHPDPVFGEELLMRLHEEADAILRERTLARTDKYVEHLHRQLQRTSVAEYRTALVNALTSQEKLRMAAMADVPFSVDVVSGPVVSAGPTSPRPMLFLAIALALGIAVSTFIVLIWDALRPRACTKNG